LNRDLKEPREHGVLTFEGAWMGMGKMSIIQIKETGKCKSLEVRMCWEPMRTRSWPVGTGAKVYEIREAVKQGALGVQIIHYV
jgi:hypothetical protein